MTQFQSKYVVVRVENKPHYWSSLFAKQLKRFLTKVRVGAEGPQPIPLVKTGNNIILFFLFK